MSVVLGNDGYCPVCAQETLFRAQRAWLRDHFFCTKCGSIPRERALMRVIEFFFPDWRNMVIHKTSPIVAATTRGGGGFFTDLLDLRYI